MSREDEIRERVEKATKGPWWFDYKAYQMRSRDDVLVTEDIISPDDQNFIANAITDIPYLQDELRKARERIAELEKENEELEKCLSETDYSDWIG